ncbi:MAG: hypothetical protein JXB05_19275 [Myxococcaceae bacterium]|nr:hypothetical protein [Myxococcaceae bacterium]
MGLRLDLGAKGQGRLAITGRDAVRVALNLEGLSPKDVGVVDSAAKKGLSEYDAHQAGVRQRVATGLAELQRAIT